MEFTVELFDDRGDFFDTYFRMRNMLLSLIDDDPEVEDDDQIQFNAQLRELNGIILDRIEDTLKS